MAALLVLFLASASVGAVRVLDEGINVRCALLENVYIDARNKTERSVKRDGDVSDKRNLIRVVRAARSLEKALRADCDWATNLPKVSHDADAPFLSEFLNSKLAERPCGDQALAIARTGKLKEAMDAFMAEEGECPATSHLAKGEGSPDVADLAKALKQVVESDVDDADVRKTVIQETEEPDIDDAALVKEAELDVEESDADIDVAAGAKKAIEAAGRSLLEIASGSGVSNAWYIKKRSDEEWREFYRQQLIWRIIFLLIFTFFPLAIGSLLR
eukprot:TRINITY_DN3457_c0_g1_i4.p1 TRINITY_DN3457_c0_g1~~TRINITY_DN3457_c0_g1_i4.p1  ORF type:complete len:273 (+),score=53.09 TRINITY_DN3457_c0_g1_i4:58-876(+)